MKRIIRLRLINWHYFANINTEIRNITFLTGPNGTGKSTVIDAIQILIEGTTNPSNFNKAANEKGKSGRSLLGYLKGQAGIRDDGSVIAIRNGNFTSYIALEIEDDVEKKIFTVGVLFDVDSKDVVSKHYFYLDSRFPENDFQIKVDNIYRPMQYREFSSYIKSNYKNSGYQFFDTDIEYHNFTKVAFGNLPDKYFTLFKQAVSFAPISDLSKFITEYVCDAALEVDISPMQKTINQYKILQKEADELRKKQEKLQKIHDLFESYKSNVEKINLLNYMDNRVNYEDCKRKRDNVKKKINDYNDKILSFAGQISNFDDQLEELSQSLSSYEAKKFQSDNYQLTESLANKKKDFTSKITTIQMQVNSVVTKLTRYANNYSENIDDFLRYYEDFSSDKLDDLKERFDELIETLKDVKNSADVIKDQIDTDSLEFACISLFRNNMDELKSSLFTIKTLVQSKIQQLSSNIMNVQSQLNNLSSGTKPFDSIQGPIYSKVKEKLESYLKARHSDSYVHVFCDLIDITDPTWVTAIEACIFSQKFNFFVNPAYFEEAFRIFKEIRMEYVKYGYEFPRNLAIVDTQKLIERDFQADEDSVASLIVTDDPGARAYSNYLLGRIKMCYSFSEARNSSTGMGLLADCTGYRAFATWNLDERLGRNRFIGTKISSESKEFLQNSFHALQRQYSLYTELLGKLDPLLSLEVMSNEEINSYRLDFERVKDISSLKTKIEDVDNQIHDAAYGDINDIDDKITAFKQDISSIKADRDDIFTQKGEIISELNRLNTVELPQLEEILSSYKKALETFPADKVEQEYEPFYNKLIDSKQMTLNQIKEELKREYNPLFNEQTKQKVQLRQLKAEYCGTYHLNYQIENYQNNDEFDKALDEISKVMLPSYIEKIAIAHDASIKEFKDDFIYKLRATIESVYSQIDELNFALEENKFGRDRYQFKVAPNRDFISYYNMIMDDDLLKHGDAEDLFMEKHKTTMNDLFALISDSDNKVGEEREQILKNIALYTNYTTYLTFDLLVTRGFSEDSKPISLGKSFKSQSGGETQNPFYIAIIASFASVTRVNNKKDSNTLRLVIFDEAFSKMDSTRIMKSTELLTQFGLQCILSTPSEKLRDLVNFVDLILVTMHNDKKKRSSLDVYIDKKKEDSFIQSEKVMLEDKENKKEKEDNS